MFDTTGIGKLVLRAIVKSSVCDEAVYANTRTEPVRGDCGRQIADYVGSVAKGTPITIDPQPSPSRSALSLEVVAGKNLYVIALDGSTRARFGPGPDPIMILPPQLGADLLEDVQLGHFNADGTFKFWKGEDISNKFNEIPENAFLAFTLDRDKLDKVWQDAMPEGHKYFKAKMPFYLNLYDTTTHRPVWTFLDNMQRYEHDHHDKPGMKTHGGIHPGSAVQSLY